MTSGQVGPKLQGGDLIGLCASTQRFEPYQDQAGLQPDEAPAYLFFHSGRYRYPVLPVHPLPYWEQHGPVPDDWPDDAVFPVRHV